MPRTVTIFDVMIASPADVAAERRVVRDVIDSWNEANAARSDVMLNAIGWETHAWPAVGRPQQVIDEQVGKHADLLIAVFWTRLGTPTGSSESGTVEEIEDHLARKKPAMFYFSSVPVVPSSVEPGQLSALQAFKKKLMSNNLIEHYDSPEELRRKLTRQLASVVSTKLAPGRVEARSQQQASAVPEPKLSAEAMRLLTQAAQDANGYVLVVRTFGGLNIETNGKSFANPGESGSEALWEAAIFELNEKGLLRDRGHEGEVFSVTNEGYKVADLISETR